jgi:hypothetical protein
MVYAYMHLNPMTKTICDKIKFWEAPIQWIPKGWLNCQLHIAGPSYRYESGVQKVQHTAAKKSWAYMCKQESNGCYYMCIVF